MKKSPNGLLIGFLALVLVGIFIYASNRSSPYFNWYETYKPEDKQPYGTYVIREILESYNPNFKFKELTKSWKEDSLKSSDKGIYFFVGKEDYLFEEEQHQLLNWVAQGNTAFISAKAFPNLIMSELYDSLCINANNSNTFYFYDTLVKANFYHPELREETGIPFHFQENDKRVSYDFGCFDSTQFCEQSKFEPLGYFEPNYVNFIRVKHGSGMFYLHTSPIQFTNYHLIQASRANYAAKVLSYLPQASIYWDEYHRVEHDEQGMEKMEAPNETPLSFILANKSLRWSLYVILLLALMYLLFNTRRKQRVIAVIESPRNSSLEFVQAIGRLYFHQRSHPTLLRHQMRYFYSFIREKYRIPIQELNEENIRLISQRSGVPITVLQSIRDESNRLQPYVELSDKEILAFYKILSQFYSLAR